MAWSVKTHYPKRCQHRLLTKIRRASLCCSKQSGVGRMLLNLDRQRRKVAWSWIRRRAECSSRARLSNPVLSLVANHEVTARTSKLVQSDEFPRHPQSVGHRNPFVSLNQWSRHNQVLLISRNSLPPPTSRHQTHSLLLIGPKTPTSTPHQNGRLPPCPRILMKTATSPWMTPLSQVAGARRVTLTCRL